METCYTFKGQSLENGLSCMVQALGSTVLQKVEIQHDWAQASEHKGCSKRNRSIWSQVCSLLPVQFSHWCRTQCGAELALQLPEAFERETLLDTQLPGQLS